MKALSRNIFILSTIFCLHFSCTTEPLIVVVDNVPVEKLSTESTYRLSDPIPPEIYTLTDDLLLLLPYRSSTIINVFDVNSKSITKEKLATFEKQMKVTDDVHIHTTLAFLNKTTNTYAEYELKDGCLQLKRNTSMGDLAPTDVIRVGEDIYINLGKYKEGLFRVLDNQKKSVKAYGKPLTIPTGYMSMQGNNLYFVSQKMGYVACYGYKNGTLHLKWEADVKQIANNQPGFDGIIAKEKNIYTLYNRHILSNAGATTQSLLIFDRTGNPFQMRIAV